MRLNHADDSPWKEALEVYFNECLAFFFPKAAIDIDWKHGYQFLDKELQQVAPEAPTGRRTVDKLVKAASLPRFGARVAKPRGCSSIWKLYHRMNSVSDTKNVLKTRSKLGL
jgi:hypothetical protein